MNDFNKWAKAYEQTNNKPDKKYSIKPTIIDLAGKIRGKTILDLGCGSGFLTKAFSEYGAKKVIGVDNSEETLKIARSKRIKFAEFREIDAFNQKLPESDIVLAPFIINYSKNYKELSKILQNIRESLVGNGKLVGIIDIPDNDQTLEDKRKSWGAIKRLKEKKDFSQIEIELYDQGRLLLPALQARYISSKIMEKALQKTGFSKIKWHLPIIAREGILKFGGDFWNMYKEKCELRYFTAYEAK